MSPRKLHSCQVELWKGVQRHEPSAKCKRNIQQALTTELPDRLLKKLVIIPNSGKEVKNKWITHALLGGMSLVRPQPHVNSLKPRLTTWLSSCTLGPWSQGRENFFFFSVICSPVLTAALLLVARDRKLLKCTSMGKCLHNLGHIHMTEEDSAVKGVSGWYMQLGQTSKKWHWIESQSQKGTHSTIPLT